MANLTRLLHCFLWLMYLNGATFTTTDIYTNIWAVKIRGSLKEAKQLASKYNFSYKMHLFDDYYIYKKPDLKQRSEKTDASVEIDKKLDLEPKVEWFEQQKERQNQLLSTNFNDPLFKDQWYIGRVNGPTYNMSSVWPRYTGSGIVVAVVDDGVNGNHAELSPNYNAAASYDFLEGDAIPVPSGKTVSGHGNACAGIIAAAANNRICGVGLAYNAKIAGLRIYDENVKSNDAIESAALSYKLDVIDIYSNSWGPGDIGVQVEGPGPLTSQALERGTKTGRNGLGAIYTFAAGNGGITQDSCAYNGYVNSIYTIAINGVNSDGSNPSYAEECPGIMATTYSRDPFKRVAKVITVGKSSSQCDEVFSSSSAAAAMASGLIALTLEANPKLSWRDVQHVIVQSARSAPGGTPLQRGYWVTNKANLTVSKFYGFGLMNAGLMVYLAGRWSPVPQQRKCEIRGQERNRPIPSTFSVTFANCEIKFLEHVQIKIHLNFDRRGYLYLELEAPSGTKSPLTRKRRLDVIGDKNLTNWFITTLFNWGESPVGQWTLRIENLDTNHDNKGTLHSWSLILYGTSSDPLQNNTHAKLPSVLPTRPATPSPTTPSPTPVLPTEATTGKQNPSTTTATPSPKPAKPEAMWKKVMKIVGPILLVLAAIGVGCFVLRYIVQKRKNQREVKESASELKPSQQGERQGHGAATLV